MTELLVPILVFVAVAAIGTGAALLLGSRRKAVRERLLVGDSTITVGADDRTNKLAQRVGRAGHAVGLGRNSSALKAKLARAGIYSESAPAAYLASKVMCLALGVCAGGLAVAALDMGLATKAYLVLLASGILFFVPNIVLGSRLAQRRHQVQSHLPDAIDLLEICVCSGMGLDMAWNAVADEIRSVCPILADEMALTNLEMQLGATRTESLRHLAERTGADEVSGLVALLVQSDRFGTSIADALGTFASSMREQRGQRAEETAEKMAVRLLFPLILFIFPVMLIVMAGPTVITLARIFAGN